MAERPSDPRDYTAFQNTTLERLRALERQVLRLPDGTDPLQTFEDGQLLGDTRFLDFGAGIQATLIGDDFVRVVGQAGGVDAFDAVVDSTIGASAPDDRLFLGIGEALSYLKTIGLEDVAIAVRDVAGGTSYTETANFTSPTDVFLHGLRSSSVIASTSAGLPQWSWNGFEPTNVINSLRMDGMRFIPGTGATVQRITNLTMYHGFLQPPGESFGLCANWFGFDCVLDILTALTLSSGPADFVSCGISTRTSGTFTPAGNTSRLRLLGCNLGGDTGADWALPRDFDIIATGSPDRLVAGGSSLTMTVPVNASGRIYFSQSDVGGGSMILSVTATSAFGQLELMGDFQALTISGSHTGLSVSGLTGTGLWDITGPAILNATARSTGRFILRGEGVSGHIGADGIAGSSGTFLDFIGADVCQIGVGADGTGTTSTKKSFAFDANSDKNILDFAGDTTFPVAGTDAGTGNVIRVT